MAIVRDNVLRVGDSPAHGGLVRIAIDSGGQIARSAAGQIIEVATVQPDKVTGEWSIDLPPLDEPGAVPEGAVYRVEPARGEPYHFRLLAVDGEGPHDVENLLTDPPGALEPGALTAHKGAPDPHPVYATVVDLVDHADTPHGGGGGGAHPDAAEHEALGLETDAGAQAKADAALVVAQAYADAAVAALVGAAPEQLDALNELAAALGDDPNFAATVNAAIAARLTEGQADARYRQITQLIGTADLDFAPATQAELDAEATARVSGDDAALPKSLLDAKGDLIVPSAADTAARLAAGANGHVLTADSAVAAGVKWAAGGSTPPIVGRAKDNAGTTYLAPLPGLDWVGSFGVHILFLNRIYTAPFVVEEAWTPAEILVEVMAAVAASGVRVWFYNCDADLQPTTLVLDTGVAMDSSTTGVKSITGLTTTFQPGRYACQWISSHSINLRSLPVFVPVGSPAAPGLIARELWRDGGAPYGAAPAIASKWQAAFLAGEDGMKLPIYWR